MEITITFTSKSIIINKYLKIIWQVIVVDDLSQERPSI